MTRWRMFLMSVIVCGTGTALAHPMGNFSINHYSKINISAKSVEIIYIIDRAEIPTFQEMNNGRLNGKSDDPNIKSYLVRQEKLLKTGLSLTIDSQPVPLEAMTHRATFADGAGGLPTLKLEFVFSAQLKAVAGAHQLAYADANFPGRAGWKEIVVVGDTISHSSTSSVDRSQELTVYSADLLNSPPQDLSVSASYQSLNSAAEKTTGTAAKIPSIYVTGASNNARAASGIAAKKAQPKTQEFTPASKSNRARTDLHAKGSTVAPSLATSTPTHTTEGTTHAANTPRSRFTQLISTQGTLSIWILLSAALISASLGALHALEPGHGKTIVAAYLVGSRGTAAHAVLLGIIVTAAHTAGVFLLGAVTLYASQYIVPEHLYPWLGTISGLSVAGLGAFMFLRHLTGETGEHSHSPGEQHSHWFLSMLKSGSYSSSAERGRDSSGLKTAGRSASLRELCLLGITGGIVPCPAALVVLLSAFSLHRIGFGLFLITAFSVGLAAVLVVIGLTMVYAKRFMASRLQPSRIFVRYSPLLSSAFMVVLGTAITASAAAGILRSSAWSKEKLVPFVTVILLGLFLGMRHSTDPDHVVAVSTIVSRQGTIRSSAMIGLLWGLGHTITIFIVGSAIIIFGVVVPPRLGLSMEFCVALMLIILGMANLTGVMKWLTKTYSPSQKVTQSPLSAILVHASTFPKSSRGFSDYKRKLRDETVGKLGPYQTLRPLAVGLVHGMAGSAAVALLVLSTIKTPFWATAYLLVFGFGTMVGMMLMTAAISVPLVLTGKKFLTISRHLTMTSGVISVTFGLFLVYQIGIIDGLFAAHPHWIPQ
jgi:ABC-type nickel/cobalt efflux system permease component RcnA